MLIIYPAILLNLISNSRSLLVKIFGFSMYKTSASNNDDDDDDKGLE